MHPPEMWPSILWWDRRRGSVVRVRRQVISRIARTIAVWLFFPLIINFPRPSPIGMPPLIRGSNSRCSPCAWPRRSVLLLLPLPFLLLLLWRGEIFSGVPVGGFGVALGSFWRIVSRLRGGGRGLSFSFLIPAGFGYVVIGSLILVSLIADFLVSATIIRVTLIVLADVAIGSTVISIAVVAVVGAAVTADIILVAIGVALAVSGVLRPNIAIILVVLVGAVSIITRDACMALHTVTAIDAIIVIPGGDSSEVGGNIPILGTSISVAAITVGIIVITSITAIASISVPRYLSPIDTAGDRHGMGGTSARVGIPGLAGASCRMLGGQLDIKFLVISKRRPFVRLRQRTWVECTDVWIGARG